MHTQELDVYLEDPLHRAITGWSGSYDKFEMIGGIINC